MGALSITGIPSIKSPFEPLVPGAIKVPNTNRFVPLGPEHADDDERFAAACADAIDSAIERGGPRHGGRGLPRAGAEHRRVLLPAAGYFARVREICDRHGVLLVSDEVICAFGRLGEWFGADRFGYQPDIITVAKGVTSGLRPAAG